jgi:cyclopropane fatty-acyl-phospholipid synthase-like methyltransferase
MKTWKEIYQKRLAAYELEHEKAGYGNKQGQINRFSIIDDLLGLEGNEKIVDFGCGTGLFCHYLKEKYPNLRYFGYDIVVDILAEAMERNIDGALFFCEKVGAGRLFEALSDCDVVTSIGLFSNFDGSVVITTAEAFSCLRSNGRFVMTALNQQFRNDYEVKYEVDGKAQSAFDSEMLDWVFQDVGFEDIRKYSLSAMKEELSGDLTKYHEVVVMGTRP